MGSNDDFDSGIQENKKQIDYEAIAKCFNTLVEWAGKAWSQIQSMRSHTFEELTYRDVIEELVNNRPKDIKIVKGAAVRKVFSDRIEITIFYLDKNNNPVWGNDPRKPYGCVKRTRKLSAELESFFADKEVLIFE